MIKNYFKDWTKFELAFLITGLVGPILLLINDIYGSYNWKKLKASQKKKELMNNA